MYLLKGIRRHPIMANSSVINNGNGPMLNCRFLTALLPKSPMGNDGYTITVIHGCYKMYYFKIPNSIYTSSAYKPTMLTM